jgi:recombination protein RecT
VTTSELGQQIERAQHTRKRRKGAGAVTLLNKLRPEIERALPRSIRADRLARVIQTELRKNPALGECDPDSFLGAVLTAAQLGLEPGPLGLVYFNPRYSKQTGTDEVQLTIGYRGYIALALRHPDVAAIDAHAVYTNDECVVTYGSAGGILHRPTLKGARGPLIGAYAICFLANGHQLPRYLDLEQIEDRRKHATTDKVWSEHYDAMAIKSAVRALNNVMPVSAELQRAEAVDYQSPHLVDLLDHEQHEVLPATDGGAVIDVTGSSQVGAPVTSTPAHDDEDDPPPAPPPTDDELIASAIAYDEHAEGDERVELDHFITLEQLPASHNEWSVEDARAVLEFADRPL